MRVGPLQRPHRNLKHIFIETRAEIVSPATLRRFDAFDLATACRCGGRRGVFTAHGTSCRRCGRPVPAPKRDSFAIGER